MSNKDKQFREEAVRLKLEKALAELKQVFVEKGEATDLFGRERAKDNVAGIVGNVMQSFGCKDLYQLLLH